MNSKSLPLTLGALVLSLLSTAAARDDVSATLSDVHICCDSCVKAIDKTVGGVSGASDQADKDAKTITLTAADKPTIQKAVDALVAAGFYGTSSDPDIKVATATVKDATVQSLQVSGVLLCCKKCVADFNKAVKSVDGVTGSNAAKDASTVTINGTFNAKDVVAALNSAGFAAQVSQ